MNVENDRAGWTVAPMPLAQLPALLPPSLAGVSASRAVIISDQIRSAIASPTESTLLAWLVSTISTGRVAESERPVQDVVAVAWMTHAPGCDLANLLHVGWTTPAFGRPEIDGAIETLVDTMAVACQQRGVTFVQWATDPIVDREQPSPWAGQKHLADVIGFTPVGTLDYLILGLNADAGGGNVPPATCEDHSSAVELVSVEGAVAVAELEAIVEATYSRSQDCPALERFRTPGQILAGYRAAQSYAPELWFRVVDAQKTPGATVGCVLLARHPGVAAEVIELVYMGVVPEHRGHRFGDAMVAAVVQLSRQRGAERLILAVDRANPFAGELYRRHGLERLFSETVWGWTPPLAAPSP